MTNTTSTTIPIRPLEGRGLFAASGFRGAAVATGVKSNDALDLALIVSDEPCSVAGVFTTNRCAAAPVALCRDTIRRTRSARSIVINSGNANALTGTPGRAHASSMQRRLETTCGGPGLVLSTGIIGVPLPIDRVLEGIDLAAANLTRTAETDVARAMLTTDSRTKHAAVQVGEGPEPSAATDTAFDDGPVPDGATRVVGGVAKGSGMIHPDMATMLAVVATDAPIASGPLHEMLERAVDRSFHCISVDGDTSTNDSVLLLARRPASHAPPLDDDVLDAIARGVEAVCRSLAEQIVSDGEGVHRTMEVTIDGAPDDRHARRIADSVARSTLVKTALAGADPNWGRILSAAGAAGVDLDPSDCTLRLGDEVVFDRGVIREGDARRRRAVFAGERVRVALTVGPGAGRGRMITTDLSKRYVELNSEYTT